MRNKENFDDYFSGQIKQFELLKNLDFQVAFESEVTLNDVAVVSI
jgi:hypothetical protein